MINLIAMYYDPTRADIAQIAIPAATAFAQANGYDLIIRATEAFPDANTAMFYKPLLIAEQLPPCAKLIYVDVDILFRPGATDQELFRSDLNVSCDFNGLCVGFMALRNTETVRRAIQVWNELGPLKGAPQHDQTTFKWLVENVPWITGMTSLIPMGLVSNPRHPVPGTVAHHFWSQHSGKEWIAKSMAEYRFEPVLPAKV
jgi:hypothetical protein